MNRGALKHQDTMIRSGVMRQATMNCGGLIHHYESDQSKQQDSLATVILGGMMRLSTKNYGAMTHQGTAFFWHS